MLPCQLILAGDTEVCYEQHTSMLAVVPLITYNLQEEGVVLPQALTWEYTASNDMLLSSTIPDSIQCCETGVNMLTRVGLR